MSIIKKQGKLELIMRDGLLEKMTAICLDHYPNEFGGFLLGRYSPNCQTVYVDDFIIPVSYRNTPTSFNRSTKGLINEFQQRFDEHQQEYIGEWHSHPDNSAEYSLLDLRAMHSIAVCKTVNTLNPILLIVAITENKLDDFILYYYHNKKLIPYE